MSSMLVFVCLALQDMAGCTRMFVCRTCTNVPHIHHVDQATEHHQHESTHDFSTSLCWWAFQKRFHSQASLLKWHEIVLGWDLLHTKSCSWAMWASCKGRAHASRSWRTHTGSLVERWKYAPIPTCHRHKSSTRYLFSGFRTKALRSRFLAALTYENKQALGRESGKNSTFSEGAIFGGVEAAERASASCKFVHEVRGMFLAGEVSNGCLLAA